MRHGVLLVSMTVLLWCVAGCVPKATINRPEKNFRVATREELLLIVEENMRRLETLQAKGDIKFIRQDVLVPVMGSSKKTYLRAEVTGLLFLYRALTPGQDTRNVFFHGAVMQGKGFSLLGIGDKFWISLPNPRADDPDEPPGHVITGDVYKKQGGRGGQEIRLDPTRRQRPRGLISARPQDFLDLLLFDEVFALIDGKSNMLCYRETWDDHYVLTFLRPDWQEHIVSRIWIERKDLRVTIHQIFDANGEILAEARFRDYGRYKIGRSNLTVEVPHQVCLLWPRDYTVMEIELSAVRVNKSIPEKRWQPQIDRGYRVVPEERLARERVGGLLETGN